MRFPMLAADIAQSRSNALPEWSRLRRILVSATLLAFVAAGS